MSTLLQFSLITHIVLGLVGVIALYAILIGVLKKDASLKFLQWSSVTSFVSIMASWIAGGYYYVIYYGGAVKPIIKEGDFPWAHLIFMEVKEHAFLLLPFMSLVLSLIFLLIGERVLMDNRMRNSTAFIAAVATVIGTFIALAGIIVTGGAR